MDIMDGIPYSEIEGFLPKPASQFFEEMFSPYPVTERSGKKSEEYSPSRFRAPLLSSDEGSSKLSFLRYWNVLIGTDLEGFLDEDDNNWRRLKLKEICYSQDCNKARQREKKRPYMRKKRHPFHPEFDPKYDRRKSKKS
jgi:hypothetical protein